MRIKRGIAVITTVSMLVTPSLFAADANPIQLTAISCLSASQPAKVVASIPATAKSARVFFKAQGQTAEYYLDMRRAANGTWFAFLPFPEPKTTAAVYRVVLADEKGVQTSSAVLTTTVTTTCPVQNLTTDDQRITQNLVVGLTGANQSPVPIGFQCRGIVSYITTANELRPNEECRRILAAAAAGAGSTTAAGTGAAAGAGTAGAGAAAAGTVAAAGMSAATLGALAALGLGAVGYAVYENNKSNNPTSPSRP